MANIFIKLTKVTMTAYEKASYSLSKKKILCMTKVVDFTAEHVMSSKDVEQI